MPGYKDLALPVKWIVDDLINFILTIRLIVRRVWRLLCFLAYFDTISKRIHSHATDLTF